MRQPMLEGGIRGHGGAFYANGPYAAQYNPLRQEVAVLLPPCWRPVDRAAQLTNEHDLRMRAIHHGTHLDGRPQVALHELGELV